MNKKNFKKIIALVLSMITIFAMSIPAFASEKTVSIQEDMELADISVVPTASGYTFKLLSGNHTVPYGFTVGYGYTTQSYQIRVLQAALNTLGYNAGTVDGAFGTNTYNAVRRFQSAESLGVDGICGNATWTRLATRCSSKTLGIYI